MCATVSGAHMSLFMHPILFLKYGCDRSLLGGTVQCMLYNNMGKSWSFVPESGILVFLVKVNLYYFASFLFLCSQSYAMVLFLFKQIGRCSAVFTMVLFWAWRVQVKQLDCDCTNSHCGIWFEAAPFVVPYNFVYIYGLSLQWKQETKPQYDYFFLKKKSTTRYSLSIIDASWEMSDRLAKSKYYGVL